MKKIILSFTALFLIVLATNAAKPPMAVRYLLDDQEEKPQVSYAKPAEQELVLPLPVKGSNDTPQQLSEKRQEAILLAQANAERSARQKLGEGELVQVANTDPTQAKQTVAVITTKLGKIVIAFDEDAAPKTVANFKKLAGEGFYDGTTFHRVIPGFMIQGGDPNSKSEDRDSHGKGGPGYTVPAEIKLKHTRGAVAMARLPDQINPQRESSGSQFFICVVDATNLDGGYTVFGHVISGMDVADKIVAQPRDGRDNPVEKIDMKVKLEGADPHQL